MSEETEAKFRNRITGYENVDPQTLVSNPKNWRLHPDRQRYAVDGALTEVGWVQDIVVNTTTGNLVDGHLRLSIALDRNEKSVPVKYVTLSQEEEELILATMDPLSTMAETDEDKLADLLAGIEVDNVAVAAVLDDLAGSVTEHVYDEEEQEVEENVREAVREVSISYSIPFDSEEQQQAWYDLLRWLRRRHGGLPTVSARLSEFIRNDLGIKGPDDNPDISVVHDESSSPPEADDSES